jgi:predicted Zn-dependent protease
MTELFELLRREAARDPSRVELFFSGHPPPQDRIARLQTELGRASGGTRDSAAFQSVKRRLMQLPPPKGMPRS